VVESRPHSWYQFPIIGGSSCARHQGTLGKWRPSPRNVRLETRVSRRLTNLGRAMGHSFWVPNNPNPEDLVAHFDRIPEMILLLSEHRC